MIKKTGIYLCLTVFLFQAVLFNAFLYSSVLFAKIDEGGYSKQITLQQDQFKKLNWLSENEFSFGNYLFDVKEIKHNGNTVTVFCKVDLKEKDLIEKLKDLFKQSKNKKTSSFSFIYGLTEPYKMSDLYQSKNTFCKNFILSIPRVLIPKSAPPPKV